MSTFSVGDWPLKISWAMKGSVPTYSYNNATTQISGDEAKQTSSPFNTHPKRGSDVWHDFQGTAKVTEFNRFKIGADQDVGALDVSMNDVIFVVQGVQGRGHGFENGENLGLMKVLVPIIGKIWVCKLVLVTFLGGNGAMRFLSVPVSWIAFS